MSRAWRRVRVVRWSPDQGWSYEDASQGLVRPSSPDVYDFVPSTAARVAVNIRFFQRNGLDRTTAIGVAGLDSGFVAQINLMRAMSGSAAAA